MTNNDVKTSVAEALQTIRNVAGDIEFGYFGGKFMRGNIGGPVMRACDRIEAALASLPAVEKCGYVLCDTMGCQGNCTKGTTHADSN